MVKLTIFRASLLAFLIAAPHETECFDMKDAGLTALVAAVFCGIGYGIYNWFHISDEQVVQESKEMYERLMQQHNRSLENYEKKLENITSWNITENELEEIAKSGIDAQLLVRSYSYQIIQIEEQLSELKSRIDSLRNKYLNDDETELLIRAQKEYENLEVLRNRFILPRDVFQGNVGFFNFYTYEQKLHSKYFNELNDLYSTPQQLISAIKCKNVVYKYEYKSFPVYGYVKNLESDQDTFDNILKSLDNYPNTKNRAFLLQRKLEGLKTSITSDFQYQEEVLDYKRKLAEEQERRAQAKLEEAQRKEEEVARRNIEQFATSIGQGLREYDLDQKEENLRQQRADLKSERDRILKQAKKNNEQIITDRETRAAELAARAGTYAKNKLDEMKSSGQIAINPELLDIDQIIIEIEQDEFDMASKHQPYWYYENPAVKERAEKKAVEKVRDSINKIV